MVTDVTKDLENACFVLGALIRCATPDLIITIFPKLDGDTSGSRLHEGSLKGIFVDKERQLATLRYKP